jgi:trimethylamine--corrinoid protein Co-methyltransferase
MVTVAAAGVSSPMTLAGTIAQINAEELAGLTISQVMRPGAPSPYYAFPGVADMSTGSGLQGTPENAMMYAAVTQLGRELYGMSTEINALVSDGVIWEQSLFAKASGALMTSFAGVNLINGCGFVDTALAANPVQLVMDDEIIGITRRISRGIEVNNDTLGLEAIARVGPRGTFLADEHTLKYLRTDEFFRPSIFDRDSRMSWLSKGAKGLEQKAKEKALTILEEHKVPSLPEDVVKELRSIVNKADQELAG